MEIINLSQILKTMYDNRVAFIRNKNMELERQYFIENVNHIPLGEIMMGLSYEDCFTSCKNDVKSGNKQDISEIFTLLQEYFLFSAGHDLMFKKKLEADFFVSVPMDDLIYPMLYKTVTENYTDLSVMKENPNLKTNLEGIDRLVYTYTDLQSFLYFLYYNDFQIPKDWEQLFPETHEEIINILNKSEMTIGDFLHGLIDFKCKTMVDVLSEIPNPKLKQEYIKKVEALQREKHEEASTFAHVELPITYFLNHTIYDFENICDESLLQKSEKPKVQKKLF